MSKRILFAGSRASGHFAYEEALSKGWDIEFIDTDYNYIKRQVADISAVAEKGCDCIIYDTREYLEEAEVIADVIASIRRANGAKPILLVPTANKENSLIGACLDKDIKLFINTGTGTPTDWKRELVLNITGHYDAEENEPKFTREAREYNSRRKIKNDSFLTIGVAGSCHRIGTTTQAIQITRFLNMMGYKACLIEANGNMYPNKRLQDEPRTELSFFEKIRLIFNVEIDEPDKGYIREQGLDLYYKHDYISELTDQNYDYFVYDYGVYTDAGFNKTAFLKDNLQFFCTGGNTAEFEYALDIAENLSYKNVDLIFSFTAEADRVDIEETVKEQGTNGRIFFSEYTPNPFILSNIDLYKEMIPLEENENTIEILKEKPKKKKIRFFRRGKNE